LSTELIWGGWGCETSKEACRDGDFAASRFDSLSGDGVHGICGSFPFHLFSLTAYKKPANQQTITALPLHVPPQIALSNSIYHSILLPLCFACIRVTMLNYAMIHVKNNLPTSFFGDL